MCFINRQREDIEEELRVLKEELTECKAQLLSKDGKITDLGKDLGHFEMLVKSQVRKEQLII